MIPFSIAGGLVYYEGGDSLEIRFLELMPDGFRFRIPHSHEKRKMERFRLYFYRYWSQDYEEICLNDFEWNLLEEKQYYSVFEVFTKQTDFRESSVRLSGEYLSYIEHKLYDEDEELSHALTSSPALHKITLTEDISAQREGWAREIHHGFRKESWDFLTISQKDSEWILLLDQPLRMEEYLTFGAKKTAERKWTQHALSWHPLAKQKISGIMIGNDFCMHLIPKLSLILRVMEKAWKDDDTLYMTIPPVPQSSYDTTLEFLWKIHQTVKKADRFLPIYVNDMGIYSELQKDAWSHFLTGRGILMNKKGKDPRVKYRLPIRPEMRTSYEPDPLDEAETLVYLPYYQTNTATFCTMYASCRFQDRGHLARVSSCPHYCLKYHFLYPDHLHVIGQYNSLFALNQNCLRDGSILKRYLSDERKKVVVRL